MTKRHVLQLSKPRLEFIASLGYKSYLIEEEAGLPLDTRNLLNLPRHRRENMKVDGGRNGHSRTPAKGSPTLRRYEQHGTYWCT